MNFTSVSYGWRASRCSSVRRIRFTSWPTDCMGVCGTRFFQCETQAKRHFSHGLPSVWGSPSLLRCRFFWARTWMALWKRSVAKNHKIPAIMSWPYCFPLISLEVCLPQRWIRSPGFHPGVWIRPRRLHKRVGILAAFAAFCSALLLTSVVHGLQERLKAGEKPAYLNCEREKSLSRIIKQQNWLPPEWVLESGFKNIRSGRETLFFRT